MHRALSFRSNTMRRRWHVELAGASGGRFGGALAYVMACRLPAAISIVPGWSAEVARLRAVAERRGNLADGDMILRWFDALQLAMSPMLRMRPAISLTFMLRTDFEKVSVSSSAAVRVMECALATTRVRTAMAQRLDIGEARCATVLAKWAPMLRVTGNYVFNVFVRLPLKAWPADARVHPPEGANACRFGCQGRELSRESWHSKYEAHYLCCVSFRRMCIERTCYCMDAHRAV